MQENSKATALAQTGSARASNIPSAGRLIRCRGKSNAFLIAACVVRNRCAEVRDSNPSISRSRLRIGSCEFSAPFSRANDQTDGFLLRRSPEAPSCTMQARAFRCSPTRLAGCGAAASALLVCRVASERRCRDPRPHHQLHAIGTRVRVHSRRPSRPGASAEGGSLRWRKLAAILGPNFTVRARIVSSLTSTPRCAIISSASRKLSVKQKRSHIA